MCHRFPIVALLLLASYAVATARIPDHIELAASRGARVALTNGLLTVQFQLKALPAEGTKTNYLLRTEPRPGESPQETYVRIKREYQRLASAVIDGIASVTMLRLKADQIDDANGAGAHSLTPGYIDLPLSRAKSAAISIGFEDARDQFISFRTAGWTATVTLSAVPGDLARPPAVGVSAARVDGDEVCLVTGSDENHSARQAIIPVAGVDSGLLITGEFDLPRGLNNTKRVFVGKTTTRAASTPGSTAWVPPDPIVPPSADIVSVDVSMDDMVVNARFQPELPSDTSNLVVSKVRIAGVSIADLPPTATEFRPGAKRLFVRLPPESRKPILRALRDGTSAKVTLTGKGGAEIWSGDAAVTTLQRDILKIQTSLASLTDAGDDKIGAAAVINYSQSAFDANHAHARQQHSGFDGRFIDNKSKASTFDAHYDYVLHSLPRAAQKYADSVGLRLQAEGQVGGDSQANAVAGLAWQYYTFNTTDLGRVPLVDIGIEAGSELKRALPGKRDTLFGRLAAKFERTWLLDDLLGGLLSTGLIPHVAFHPLVEAYYDTRMEEFDALARLQFIEAKSDGTPKVYFETSFGREPSNLEYFGTVLLLGLSSEF